MPRHVRVRADNAATPKRAVPVLHTCRISWHPETGKLASMLGAEQAHYHQLRQQLMHASGRYESSMTAREPTAWADKDLPVSEVAEREI
jgi:hypothetical protein